ncbi:hypothetical protein EDEG_03879 [Edhazardia aedis USNM 41457]|uniref:Uncharacterized protein n=1 Tax=Edhazardia aedis (strain USNM 41457) TaxID=1003232 RepID=J9D157_EDHAE|nr:hypothetical protein EDEG_03879 [Edhazardia aedis USNM 41457]|eukprot:EJW01556.1 hypothetical protein EDEG_03879 [Edhazardia aedis USNM 41457]
MDDYLKKSIIYKGIKINFHENMDDSDRLCIGLKVNPKSRDEKRESKPAYDYAKFSENNKRRKFNNDGMRNEEQDRSFRNRPENRADNFRKNNEKRSFNSSKFEKGGDKKVLRFGHKSGHDSRNKRVKRQEMI